MLTGYHDGKLITTCHYHQEGGVHCFQGMLHKYRKIGPQGVEVDTDGVISEPVLLEGLPLHCPACEGKGVILTEQGRETLQFFQTFGYPFLRDMVQDIIKEEMQG